MQVPSLVRGDTEIDLIFPLSVIWIMTSHGHKYRLLMGCSHYMCISQNPALFYYSVDPDQLASDEAKPADQDPHCFSSVCSFHIKNEIALVLHFIMVYTVCKGKKDCKLKVHFV